LIDPKRKRGKRGEKKKETTMLRFHEGATDGAKKDPSGGEIKRGGSEGELEISKKTNKKGEKREDAKGTFTKKKRDNGKGGGGYHLGEVTEEREARKSPPSQRGEKAEGKEFFYS